MESKRSQKYPRSRDGEVVELVSCEKCGAVPGQPCIPQTPQYSFCRPHKARWGKYNATKDEPAFMNTAEHCEPRREDSGGFVYYRHENTSPYLRLWSGLLQAAVSQAGTSLLTGRFHDKQCGIYKAEGGCRIDGINELVLLYDGCYFDYGRNTEKKPDPQLRQLADLISAIALSFDPNDPIESILGAAAECASTTPDDLRTAIESSRHGGVFGPNALSSFFRHTGLPGRAYERFCLNRFGLKTDAEVDEIFSDRDLGASLLKQLNEKLSRQPGYHSAYCCSPSRFPEGLRFWVNTGGGKNQIQGWKTQEELEAFIASDEPLVTTRS